MEDKACKGADAKYAIKVSVFMLSNIRHTVSEHKNTPLGVQLRGQQFSNK